MKTFDFIQASISHNLKDLHSKSLEPDCLSPLLAIMTQSPEAGERDRVRGAVVVQERLKDLFADFNLGFGS